MEAELVQTAYLILGHGWFELGGFATAEQAYVRLLSGTVAGDDRDRVQERLLAAVYKQGEAADGAGNADEAVGHFLRLAQIDPTDRADGKGPLRCCGYHRNGGTAGGSGRFAGRIPPGVSRTTNSPPTSINVLPPSTRRLTTISVPPKNICGLPGTIRTKRSGGNRCIGLRSCSWN